MTKPSKRLLDLYNKANQEMKDNGLTWYFDANSLAHRLALQYKQPMKTVCDIIAILSPACTWEQNKKDATNLLKAYYERGFIGVVGTKVSTYGTNKDKALKVLLGDVDFVKTKTNYKTYSFSKNIYDPYGVKFVTIDRHAVKAYKGIKQAGSISVTPKVYKLAENAYKAVADYLQIAPCQAQAVIWLAYKESVNR